MSVLTALDPDHTSCPEEIAPVLERWGKVELKDYKGGDQEGYYTHLTLTEELRCLIASLYSQRSPTAKAAPRVFGSPDDKDIARRCAFYAGTDLSEKEIDAGFKKITTCLYLRCSKILMWTGKRRSAVVIISRGFPAITMFLFRFEK